MAGKDREERVKTQEMLVDSRLLKQSLLPICSRHSLLLDQNGIYRFLDQGRTHLVHSVIGAWLPYRAFMRFLTVFYFYGIPTNNISSLLPQICSFDF